ncbi:hypothetical protein DM02DRAFT_514975 [Periconia macrospinosa]|uniref:Uncharacterized protein n=1 Tax=Periconia macrospinosa TaxID=97972 RepID=A0A2V1E8J4_9PLEO|nr:hypothetical protein DM02DRAFT_514975 [Periconia macrospinosa]
MLFTSKTPTTLSPTLEEDPKQSHDSQKTKTSSSSHDHDERNKPSPTKPTTTRTPSTRFKEPSTPLPKRNPSNVSTKPTLKPTPSSSNKPARPPLERRGTTAQTRYVDMLLELDKMPMLHNILASLFTWILLAGYIVFPATFNKLQKDERLDEKANTELKSEALATARNIPFLYVAAVLCGVGVLGSLWLWRIHHNNYVWVINRVFLPALMNSVAGLISTLVNVYTAQEAQFSVTARATLIVTSACSVVTIFLFLMYNSVMLKYVKAKHEKETKKFEKQSEGEREKMVGGADGGKGDRAGTGVV